MQEQEQQELELGLELAPGMEAVA
eukprot:COSAG01_NODE_67244_length_267_cov_1.529762_1_plen_23_part_01